MPFSAYLGLSLKTQTGMKTSFYSFSVTINIFLVVQKSVMMPDLVRFPKDAAVSSNTLGVPVRMGHILLPQWRLGVFFQIHKTFTTQQVFQSDPLELARGGRVNLTEITSGRLLLFAHPQIGWKYFRFFKEVDVCDLGQG